MRLEYATEFRDTGRYAVTIKRLQLMRAVGTPCSICGDPARQLVDGKPACTLCADISRQKTRAARMASR